MANRDWTFGLRVLLCNLFFRDVLKSAIWRVQNGADCYYLPRFNGNYIVTLHADEIIDSLLKRKKTMKTILSNYLESLPDDGSLMTDTELRLIELCSVYQAGLFKITKLKSYEHQLPDAAILVAKETLGLEG